MNANLNTLSELVAKFRGWLAASYSQEEIDQLHTDDPGYPGWAEINTHFAKLLENGNIAHLSLQEQTDLLYLIARNWDIGTMIAWLSPDSHFSNDGPLNPADFLLLANTLSKLSHAEFRDAKHQFAVSCKKFTALTADLQLVLLAFFNDPDEYVKTTALEALGKLHYSNLINLLEQAWRTVNDEHSIIACLQIIERYIQDDDLLRHYLVLADDLAGKYISDYVTRTRQELKY